MGGDRPLDLVDDPALQVERRDQHGAVAPRPRVPGQRVEHLGDVGADLGVAGEEPEVGVHPGRLRVVVAGSDVHVVAHPVALAADDQDALDVGLQARDPVDHVHARLLQLLRPPDVRALVEAGLELDQADRLLAALGGVDQPRDEGRVGAGPVDGLLDRQDLRVGDRLLDEVLDRARERVVGVMDEDVARPDRGEHVVLLVGLADEQARRGHRRERRVTQLLVPGNADDVPEVGEIEQAVDLVDLVVVDLQRRDQLLAQRAGSSRPPPRA